MDFYAYRVIGIAIEKCGIRKRDFSNNTTSEVK